MTLKKILSAVLIGAFMVGLPAANFDMPFTKKVSAEYVLFSKKYAEEKAKLNSIALLYEHTKEKYENARKSGNYSKSELKKLEDEYLKAKKDYERQKKIVEDLEEKMKSDKTPKFNGLE